MTQATAPAAPEITLGWRLRMALESADIRSEQMAELLGVHRGTIARWTHDVGSPPRRIYLERWAELCGVPLAWLESGPFAVQASNAADTEASSRRPTGDDAVFSAAA